MSWTVSCPIPRSPIIPGHEIVGRIDAIGPGVEGFGVDERVGIPWLGHTCGVCPYCRKTRKICVTPPCSRATRATEGTLRPRLPITFCVSIG